MNSNANTLGNFDVYITPASPSSASSLTSSDYQNAFTRTSYGSKSLSTYTDNNSTYNDIALNGTGVSAISKTSNTFLGGMHSWDFNQSFTGTWVSNSESRLRPRFADETGTSKDPKLVVEHTAAEEGLLQDISYTYDTVGNITNMLDVSETGTGKTVVFGYDDLYRLTSASTTAATSTPYSQTYTYSSIGNILTKSDQGTYTYGETGYTNPHAATDVNGTTLVYDNNGNLTSFGNKGYLWDYRNRMTASGQTGSATTTYAYDHTVQRVWKVTGNATTTYPNMYFDTKGATTTRHIFDTTGVLIGTVEGNGIATSTNYIHTDHLGGTNVVTDKNGEAVQVLDYYPYGTLRIDSTSGTDEVHKFTGHELDRESDLTYANARYYDQDIGKWTAQDPASRDNPRQFLSDPQQLNYYSYARNNPLVLVDKNGESVALVASAPFGPIGWAIGAIATGIGGLYLLSEVIDSSKFQTGTLQPSRPFEGMGFPTPQDPNDLKSPKKNATPGQILFWVTTGTGVALHEIYEDYKDSAGGSGVSQLPVFQTSLPVSPSYYNQSQSPNTSVGNSQLGGGLSNSLGGGSGVTLQSIQSQINNIRDQVNKIIDTISRLTK